MLPSQSRLSITARWSHLLRPWREVEWQADVLGVHAVVQQKARTPDRLGQPLPPHAGTPHLQWTESNVSVRHVEKSGNARMTGKPAGLGRPETS